MHFLIFLSNCWFVDKSKNVETIMILYPILFSFQNFRRHVSIQISLVFIKIWVRQSQVIFLLFRVDYLKFGCQWEENPLTLLHQNFDNRFAVVKKYQGNYWIVKTKNQTYANIAKMENEGRRGLFSVCSCRKCYVGLQLHVWCN